MTDWNQALRPLFEKYRGRKHPLEYHNLYQLLVMVLLSARDADKHINALAPALFRRFPRVEELAQASLAELLPFIRDVTNAQAKAQWLLEDAQVLQRDMNIPLTLAGLTGLKGIGRKSANVIMSQMGVPAEGVICDLHTMRVAPRLGIAQGATAEKIEPQLMKAVPQENWHILGMALTFLGRETCRPTSPRCDQCLAETFCEYHRHS